MQKMTVLRGLKEIGDYLRVSHSSAAKYIEQRGLPAARMSTRTGHPIWVTTEDLISAWIASQDRARRNGEAVDG